MKEIWKDVKDYESLYAVSNYGRIMSLGKKSNHNKSIIMKPTKEKNGYYTVSLTKNNKRITRKVHRIVAENLIENKFNKRTVNHIDGNKLNNNVNNLEWATDKENIKHAWDIGLNRVSKKQRENAKIQQKRLTENKKIKVKQIDLHTKKAIKTWNSIKEAKKHLKSPGARIKECCEGIYKQSGGYKWEYVKEGVSK